MRGWFLKSNTRIFGKKFRVGQFDQLQYEFNSVQSFQFGQSSPLCCCKCLFLVIFAQKCHLQPGKGNLCLKKVILEKFKIPQRWHIFGKDDFFWQRWHFLGAKMTKNKHLWQDSGLSWPQNDGTNWTKLVLQLMELTVSEISPAGSQFGVTVGHYRWARSLIHVPILATRRTKWFLYELYYCY